MNKEIIVLHLSLIDGIGPAAIQKLLYPGEDVPYIDQAVDLSVNAAQMSIGQKEHMAQRKQIELAQFDLSDIYTLGKTDFMHLFGFANNIASKLCLGLKDTYALEQEAHLIHKHNIRFVTILGDNYPKLLKTIYAPPAVLYLKSDTKKILDHNKKIAFVGSRKAHRYGEKAVEQIVPEMVHQGWMIVSGGAIGADSMAHRETVNCGGKTIAIIGSGLLHPYPSSNKKLFEDIIASGGALVSPFKLSTVARPGNFPARNRVIAGLSLGCVVVQAAKKSGASITAQFALEQGREVFAIPGSIEDELSLGCHMLISQGAKLISNAEDILTEFDTGYASRTNSYLQNSQNPGQGQDLALCQASDKDDTLEATGAISTINKITKNLQSAPKDCTKYTKGSIEHMIMECCSNPCAIDQIAIATNKEMHELHEILFDLQLNGDIKQNHAGMFEKV